MPAMEAASRAQLPDDPVLARFRHALEHTFGNRIERVVLYGSRAGAEWCRFRRQRGYDSGSLRCLASRERRLQPRDERRNPPLATCGGQTVDCARAALLALRPRPRPCENSQQVLTGWPWHRLPSRSTIPAPRQAGDR